MERYLAKEKDTVLLEIVKAYPKIHIIEEERKHEIANNFLIIDGYITILAKYDQNNMVAYQATKKGVDFITEGGYTKEEKVTQYLSLSGKIKTRAIEIAVGVSIIVIATLILFYIFGIRAA